MDTPTLAPDDLAALLTAKQKLTHPGFAARLADVAGRPLEGALRWLPAAAREPLMNLSERVVWKCLDWALDSLSPDAVATPANDLNRLLVGVAGGVGGALGLPALVVELPVTTTLMLRSIADIARSQGADLTLPETRFECISVLALGAPGAAEGDAGYFATRVGLATVTREVTALFAGRGALDRTSPALLRFVATVAARFGLVVSQRTAAVLVPLAGAAVGAAVNLAFMNHFQDMAWGHFTVRRLERTYGADAVRLAFDALPVA